MLPVESCIVDAHHHLWDLRANYYPWLTDRVGPRMYGDYKAIRRDYRMAEFRVDIGSLPVRKSVHVQAEHDAADPVRETRWLQGVAEAQGSGGFPHAIVAYVDLSAPANEVEAMLAAHCASPNVRGIRQMLHQILVPGMGHSIDYLDDVRWCANLALLAAHRLSFDLQILPVQATAAAALADRYPGQTFVLVHAGQPRDQSPGGVKAWSAGLRQLALRPNIVVKLSGFGMFDPAWSVTSLRQLVLTAIDCFGPERVLFGSNFPVDGMMRSYAAIWRAYAEITAGFSDAERDAMFRTTAERIYRI